MTGLEPPRDRPSAVSGAITGAGEYVADALKYWEPKRIIYNAVLAVVVLGHVWLGRPSARDGLSTDVFLQFFFLAVVANICYCAAYAVDLFVQFSGLRDSWAKGRPALLVVGTAFAAVIAHFLSAAILGGL